VRVLADQLPDRVCVVAPDRVDDPAGQHERGPVRQAVGAGQGELRVGELGVGGFDRVRVMCAKLRERGGAAASDVAQEVLGLVAELIEVWADREMTGHDERPWSVARCPLTGERRFGCICESGG
jgi:hypothetical protein